MQIDEAAMKVITDKLVDPWHRTFARDVVEMYLKQSNKHIEPMIPASKDPLNWKISDTGRCVMLNGIPTQNTDNTCCSQLKFAASGEEGIPFDDVGGSLIFKTAIDKPSKTSGEK